jgi:low affinity Fe/Cu permease
MPEAKKRGVFDGFAEVASREASRAWFFAACCALVVLWAPTIFLGLTVDTWQLIINTLTTIITFLMVALLQNSSQRFEDAVHIKLNAMTEALADVLEEFEGTAEEIAALRKATGVEEELGT